MASERVLLTSRTVTERAADWARIDASSFESAVAALSAVEDVDAVCAVLASTMAKNAAPQAEVERRAREELIALVSMLVIRGVRTFETSDPQTVSRVLDTHAAISTGDIEVLAK